MANTNKPELSQILQEFERFCETKNITIRMVEIFTAGCKRNDLEYTDTDLEYVRSQEASDILIYIQMNPKANAQIFSQVLQKRHGFGVTENIANNFKIGFTIENSEPNKEVNELRVGDELKEFVKKYTEIENSQENRDNVSPDVARFITLKN